MQLSVLQYPVFHGNLLVKCSLFLEESCCCWSFCDLSTIIFCWKPNILLFVSFFILFPFPVFLFFYWNQQHYHSHGTHFLKLQPFGVFFFLLSSLSYFFLCSFVPFLNVSVCFFLSFSPHLLSFFVCLFVFVFI